MKDPLVTVIVPSYNHEEYIEECILSVLKQTYKNIELIVLDDGSKDNSRSIIKKLATVYNFKFIFKNNEGLSKTLNKGISLSGGEYLCFLASDDMMPKLRISEQVEIFKQHSEYSVIAGGVEIIDKKSKSIKFSLPKKLGSLFFEDFLFSNKIYAPTTMIKKTDLVSVGCFDERYKLEDISMWLRMTYMNFKIFNFKNIWAKYRIIDSDILSKREYYHVNLLKVISDYETKSPIAVRAKNFNKFKFLVSMFLKDKNKFVEYFKLYKNDLPVYYKWPLSLAYTMKR